MPAETTTIHGHGADSDTCTQGNDCEKQVEHGLVHVVDRPEWCSSPSHPGDGPESQEMRYDTDCAVG